MWFDLKHLTTRSKSLCEKHLRFDLSLSESIVSRREIDYNSPFENHSPRVAESPLRTMTSGVFRVSKADASVTHHCRGHQN